VIGGLTHNVGPATATAVIALTPVVPSTPAGLPVPPAITLNLSIDLATGVATGSMQKGTTIIPFTTTRTNHWAAGVPASKQGLFNFIINPPNVFTPDTERNVPVGYGYGSFTMGAQGLYTAAGKTADGKAWSTSGILDASSQVPIYAGFYNSLGSLHGLLVFTVSGTQTYTPPTVNVGACNTTASSTTVTCVGTSTLSTGAAIIGNGIPPSTTIATIVDATHFTISASATETGTFNLTGVGPCATTAGSATVACVGTSALVPGMNVTGSGIPSNTTVASITDATNFVLSANATSTLSGITVTGTPATLLTNCATTIGTKTVTCTDTSLLRNGMVISGTGIPTGATVASIADGTHFDLNVNATQNTSGGTSSAFPYLIKEVRVTGPLTWMRNAETAPRDVAELQRERNYRDGFQFGLINTSTGKYDPLSLKTDGGRYIAPAVRTASPALTGVLMNRPTTNNNAHLNFRYAGLPTTRPANDQNDPDAVLTLDIPNTAHPDGVISNDKTNTFFTVDPATGVFSGLFDRDDTDPTNTSQTIHRLDNVFFGIVIRQFSGPPSNNNNNNTDTIVSQLGYGAFILPDLPRAGAGANGNASDMTNSPKYSGEVKLVP
jgi:hypothetical protein